MEHALGRGVRRIRRGGAATLVATAVLVVAATPSGAGDVADGMLQKADVGLAVISEPHSSTIASVDLVDPETCEPASTTEEDGRVVSFAENPDDPSSGAQLNEVVIDYASAAEAKASFQGVRTAEQARVECGSTGKATNLAFSKGPKKVGTARFTVTADEKISGKTRTVVSVTLLQGAHVARVNFIDWDDAKPSSAKVAKRAADRLA